MGRRYLHIGIGYSGPAWRDPAVLEPTIRSFSIDWLRYTTSTWIILTEVPTQVITERLKAVLSSDDIFMITELNMREMAYGVMPTWVWDWMNRNQAVAAFGTAQGLANKLLPPRP